MNEFNINSNVWIELCGSLLLFCLVWNMSASVDFDALQHQLHNQKAILTGLALQFLVMPFLGFTVVRVMQLPHEVSLILLVLCSSPGGSFSNFFCSLFNGDLALSVAMTAISTLLSVFALPLNLFIYARLVFHEDQVVVEWSAIFWTLFLVILAITTGLAASRRFATTRFHFYTNRIGNTAGLCLVLFTAVLSNSEPGSRLWQREPSFYVAVALPCLLGLTVAVLLSTLLALPRPERVSVCLECCIQNTGVGASVALTMFQGEQLASAMAVPFYYGCVECVVVILFCLSVWKAGWTKAPQDASIWTMLVTPYEVLALSSAKSISEIDCGYVNYEQEQVVSQIV
ncbi:solute carrier family 10 (sodium/bile acid cotransporter), member 2 [Fistulifera solaris]|uniref:Solute carrier family 10 (Sodium/bile acid cotransporter), member 2 n=1 Tax=Fistulifera solaris TaxID=1519565 RepID=A0A1Z5KA67_FISSO|nr:solute carrier family 10 (sodium/bile acid cotransporter), member 2 [Fistulifera solaris]|eukprot:GAX23001.1 solute carrier family 10 (sodium/bile acid cotransporter), member 2 [Fistulifera solaris]